MPFLTLDRVSIRWYNIGQYHSNLWKGNIVSVSKETEKRERFCGLFGSNYAPGRITHVVQGFNWKKGLTSPKLINGWEDIFVATSRFKAWRLKRRLIRDRNLWPSHLMKSERMVRIIKSNKANTFPDIAAWNTHLAFLRESLIDRSAELSDDQLVQEFNQIHST